MMNNVKGFSAKEFYYNNSWNFDGFLNKSSQSIKGNILIGNSATATNNHLDVIDVVKKHRCIGQNIIVPLSYGDDKYRKWLLPQVETDENIELLLDFMPKEKYYEILSTCSYSFFGVIRQQAVGNILYALCNGIKVFLFKDSVLYKDLINLGFVVYSIDDLKDEDLKTPLSPAEMKKNEDAAINEKNRRQVIYQMCIKEIFDKINAVK